jgi:hypothetical protein
MAQKLLFLNKKSNFTVLKKKLYIFTFTVLFSLGSFAQSKTTLPSQDGPVKFMRFYPNPAVSVINFEFQKGYDKYYTFQVFNFIGKKVFDLKTVTPKINIPLTDFYRGVYIYQLRDRNGNIIDSGKFQVVK